MNAQESNNGISLVDAAAAVSDTEIRDPGSGKVRASSTSGGQPGLPNSTGGDKDRKIGHRRVNEEGEVSYKKIQSNQLIDSIQLGIRYSIGVQMKIDDRDLLMQDFMTVETHVFPRSGGLTPPHSCSDFKFQTFAPLAFRYFLKLFGINREDFLMSLCNEPLRELTNPGASGSLFFLTNDDEFIIKTVQHKEAEFLQKLLPGYYMNLNQNPHTLLPKFFGMFCYQCNQKNIRLIVMNNLLPSAIRMHLRFDLKGSTYKRKANKRERAKKSPCYKDLDFRDEVLPQGLSLEPGPYNALITTMRRDCRVLESFRIMDYSLLIGVHNLDQAAREEAETGGSDDVGGAGEAGSKAFKAAQERAKQQSKPKLVAHSTAMESIQAQTEPIDEHLPLGGIPARNQKGEGLMLYLGIIDILQSYRLKKRVEHTFKAIIHDGDTVSVHRPRFYAQRFLNFMADVVFKKVPSPLKHSPSKKGRREQSMKRIQKVSALASDGISATTTKSEFGGGAPSGSSGATGVSTGAAADSSLTTSSSSSKGDFFHRTGLKPDVVPGDYDYATSEENRPVSAADRPQMSSVSPSMARKMKPTNRQHMAIKQQSVDSLGSADHGTPSRLSVGTTGSSGWNTPTPNTWTEGTPSYTPSSLSGASLGPGIVGQSSLDDLCDETLQLEI